jgi:exodeoxyribonuclease VIII
MRCHICGLDDYGGERVRWIQPPRVKTIILDSESMRIVDVRVIYGSTIMPYDNIMLDLETMSSAPSAVIIAIGAVKFGADGPLGERFYAVSSAKLHTDQQVARGRTVSADTMDWWSKQSVDARAIFSDANSKPFEICLEEFAVWCGKEPKVWGNGSDFDNVLLSEAYRVYGIKKPWHYRHSRDLRTLGALCAAKGIKIEMKNVGVAHNALDDAVYQAMLVQAMLKALGLERL